jgi:hypothetical protein
MRRMNDNDTKLHRVYPHDHNSTGSVVNRPRIRDRVLDRQLNPELELIETLCRIEAAQDQLLKQRLKLAELLHRDPDLKESWQAFTRAGGQTAEEYERFRNGQLRPKIVRGRRHLQLVNLHSPAQ